jgi:hypothetical protein
MSVSGYSSSQAHDQYDVTSTGADDARQASGAGGAAETTGGAAAEGATIEGAPLRGGEPATRRYIPDPGASILAASLDEQAAAADVEARGVEDIDATLDEISELEAQLDELYAYRDILQWELDDPDLDLWDQLWLEFDLMDIDLQIADLEKKLGRLEDDVYNWFVDATKDTFDAFGALWSSAAVASTSDSLTGTFSKLGEDRRTTSQELDLIRDIRDRRQREIDALRRRREAQELEHSEDAKRRSDDAEKAAIRSLRPSPPAPTPETLSQLLQALDAAQRDRTRESVDRAMKEIKKLRGG